MSLSVNYNEHCQICIALDPEDLCIIHQMLKEILKQIYDDYNKFSTEIFNTIFMHPKFRQSLSLIFDSKYREISEQCQHIQLQSIFTKDSNRQIADQDGIQQIENGCETLLNIVMEKQENLKIHKQKFDRLAHQIFNCDDSNLSNTSSDDQKQFYEDFQKSKLKNHPMKFNKNSNKSRFQKKSIEILKKWFLENLENPYPDSERKLMLSHQTGMSVRQIQNWFTNSRKRYLDPIRKRYEGRNKQNNKTNSEVISNQSSISKQNSKSLEGQIEQIIKSEKDQKDITFQDEINQIFEQNDEDDESGNIGQDEQQDNQKNQYNLLNGEFDNSLVGKNEEVEEYDQQKNDVERYYKYEQKCLEQSQNSYLKLNNQQEDQENEEFQIIHEIKKKIKREEKSNGKQQSDGNQRISFENPQFQQYPQIHQMNQQSHMIQIPQNQMQQMQIKQMNQMRQHQQIQYMHNVHQMQQMHQMQQLNNSQMQQQLNQQQLNSNSMQQQLNGNQIPNNQTQQYFQMLEWQRQMQLYQMQFQFQQYQIQQQNQGQQNGILNHTGGMFLQ